MFTPTLLSCWFFFCAADQAVVRWADVALTDVAESQEFPPLADVEKLLAPTAAERDVLSEKQQRSRRLVQLNGMARFRDPFTEGAALRLSLVDLRPRESQLELFFWRGRQGIAAYYYCGRRKGGDPPTPLWGVYAVERSGDGPRGDAWRLWATDSGRYYRLQQGTFLVHYAAGRLRMTRGDAVLWSVPFASPPSEVYLNAQATIRGCERFECQGAPGPAADLPLIADVAKPAALEWRRTGLPGGVRLDPLDDGRVRLSAEPGAPEGHATTIAAAPGLQDYAFSIEEASAGTGVELADAEGEALARLGFTAIADGRLALALDDAPPPPDPRKKRPSRPAREPKPVDVRPASRVTPLSDGRLWVRLLLGAGTLRVWISPDGASWSQAPELTARVGGAARQIGLYARAAANPRAIVVSRIQVRRFQTLHAVVTDEAWRAAVAPGEAASVTRWFAAIDAAQPAGTDAEAWLKACLFRGLVEGCGSQLGSAAIIRLLEVLQKPTANAEAQLRCLDEASRLVDPAGAARLLQLYDPVGRTLVDRRDRRACSLLHEALLRADFPAESGMWLFPPALLRFEVLLALYDGRWSDVLTTVGRVQFYARSQSASGVMITGDASLAPLLEWANAVAKAELSAAAGAAAEAPSRMVRPGAAGKDVAAWSRQARKPRLPPPTDHPLVERFDRETYNWAIDFQAALGAGAMRDVCQLMLNGAAGLGNRLIPQGDDPHWRTTLPIAFAAAVEQSPELRGALRTEFGAVGELRAKESIATNDAAAVTAVAQRFPGTPAAALAERWLGDRALSAGQFSAAANHWRTATAIAAQQPDHPALRTMSADAAACQRLAAALDGRRVGDAASAPVSVGGQSFRPAEFEELLSSLIDARQPPAEPAAIPLTEGFAIRPWRRLPSAWDSRLSKAAADRATPELTTASLAPGQLIVNSPLHILSFDLAEDRIRWMQDANAPDGMLRAAAVACRPLIVGERIFVRRLRSGGSQLVCLHVADGRIGWLTEDALDVVADPLWVDQQLLGVTATPSGVGNLAVRLTRFEPQTGRILGQWPLLELRDLWKGQLSCRMAAAGGRIVATLAGCTVACTTAGEICWLRTSLYYAGGGSAAGAQALARRQTHEPPLVSDGRVYVTQPGVWNLDCLALDTGRLLWRRAEPELKRTVGVCSGKALAEMARGLTAYDAASGKPAWQYVDPRPEVNAGLSPLLAGSAVVCLAACQSPPRSGPALPDLLWLDVESGAVRARATLESTTPWPADCALGGLMLQQRGLRALLRLGGRSGGVEIVELAPRVAP